MFLKIWGLAVEELVELYSGHYNLLFILII